MRISWVPLDVSVGFRSPRLEDLRTMFPLLRESVARWQPGREHIVSDEEEFCHVVPQCEVGGGVGRGPPAAVVTGPTRTR